MPFVDPSPDGPPNPSRDLAVRAHTQLLVDRDLGAIDRFWHPSYIQHNPGLQQGVDAVRRYMAETIPTIALEISRVIADGPFVAFHQRARLTHDAGDGVLGDAGHGQVVNFDLYRVHDGAIIEHWDGIQPDLGSNPAGRSALDGPVAIQDRQLTAPNRALLTEFAQGVLLPGEFGRLDAFVRADLVQHHAHLADGIGALRAHLAGGSSAAVSYDSCGLVLAEGNFVLTQCEGTVDGDPHALYDLWRVEDGRIAEQWNITQPIPATTASGRAVV